MERAFDHVTLVVIDLEEATRFFEVLGFEETESVVVEGEEMSRYMGIENWKADHVTLVLTGTETRQEVQLFRFHNPQSTSTPKRAAWPEPVSTTSAFASMTSTTCSSSSTQPGSRCGTTS